MTVKELVAHYDGFVSGISAGNASTAGTYERALRPFIAWFAVDGRFHFRQRDVERYRKHLIERRRHRPNSVGTYLSALRRLCDHLVEQGAIGSNPAVDVVAGVHHAAHSRKPLSEVEVARLLQSVDRSTLAGARDFAIIHLMLGCALMEHQVCSLRLRDVVREPHGTSLLLRPEHTRGAPVAAAVPAAAAAALDEYLLMRYGTVPGRLERDHPLFATSGNRSTGRLLSERTVRHAVNRWLVASGVKGDRSLQITPLSLRHTAGFRLAAQGATVESLMSQMRIETPSTARLYFGSPANGTSSGAPRHPSDGSEPNSRP